MIAAAENQDTIQVVDTGNLEAPSENWVCDLSQNEFRGNAIGHIKEFIERVLTQDQTRSLTVEIDRIESMPRSNIS